MSDTTTTTAARIQSLDVVRGLAVLGILAVNAAYFALPLAAAQNPALPGYAVDAAGLAAWWVMHVFFEFKFITVFSLLFGVSLYLVGGERGDAERGRLLRARLFWLALFGVAHATLIWAGDILLTYAITGFVVMLARSWRPGTLLAAGLALFALSTAYIVGLGASLALAPAETVAEVAAEFWSPPPEALAREVAAMQGAQGLAGVLGENFRNWVDFLGYGAPPAFLRSAGVMMIGLALFKWGLFTGRAPGWALGLLTAGGAAGLALVGWQAAINAAAGFPFTHMLGAGALANTVLSLPIAIGYAAGVILILKAGALRWLTGALAAVGRMAFSNYIAQSLIMTTIFYGARGLGLFGELDRAQIWGVVAAIWIAQLVWSPLYLSRFRMGPLEWLWRRLATGKSQGFQAAAG